MDLKSKMKLEKTVNSAIKMQDKVAKFLKNAEQLSSYDENYMAYSIILKEIFNSREAFEIWSGQVEYAQTLIEQLEEKQNYSNQSLEEDINFAYGIKSSALKTLKAIIAKPVEEKLGSKIVRMTSEESDTLLNNVDEVSKNAYAELINAGFSKQQIDWITTDYAKTRSKMKTGFLTKEDELKNLDLDDAAFQTVYAFIGNMRGINGVEDNDCRTAYTQLFEYLSKSQFSWKTDIPKISEDLKRFSYKQNFKNMRGTDSSTPRADYYFDLLKEQIYSTETEANAKNREKIFNYAANVYGLDQMKAYAQHSSNISNGKGK